ncbi:hypothetical protein [Paenibacillus nasutitermitis]|uniref:CBM-cenC domain-containing protein n=1 Tax=Paenibacillus nasutitermitis TaxID=1652958 RepID=A0A917DYX5_9BACL|nr:hypothetical protein [Paenibacillus nasutitermitis]GGD80712.1 hypothetical protein GCM10010911_43560 [Paenibacillus nasutitermitis]
MIRFRNRTLLFLSFFFLLSLVIVPAVPSSVSAANLLSNGSFETLSGGAPTDWSFSNYSTAGSTTVITGAAAAGSKSVKLTAAGTTDRALYTQWYIPVTSNQLYRFKAKYKTVGSITGSAFLKVTWYDSSKTAITPTYSANPISENSNWMLLTRDLTAPVGGAYATIQIEARYGATIQFDDLQMESVTNKLGNGSFELLTSGSLQTWTFTNVSTSGSVTPQSTGGYDQPSSVKLRTTNATDRAVLSQTYLPVTAGKRYKMTAVYKTTSLNGRLYMRATFYDSSHTAITPTTSTFGQASSTWRELKRITMAPPNAAYVTFQLQVDQGASEVYWDHARLEEMSGLTDADGSPLPVTLTDDLPMEMAPADFWALFPSASLTPTSTTLWANDVLRHYYFGLDNDGYSSLDKPKAVDAADDVLTTLNPTVGVTISSGGPTQVIAGDIPYSPLVSTKSPYSDQYYARGNGGQLYSTYVPAYVITHDTKYLDRAKELANYMRYSQYTLDGDNDFARVHYPSEWSDLVAKGNNTAWKGGWDYQFDWVWTDSYGYTFDLHSPDHHVSSMMASGLVYLYNNTNNADDLNSAYDFVYNHFPSYGYHTGMYDGRRYYWTGYNPDLNGTPDDGSRPIWDATDNVMGMTARAAAQVGYYKNDAKMLEYARGAIWYLIREFDTDGKLYYDGAENEKNSRTVETHEAVTIWQAMQALPYLMKAGVDVSEELEGMDRIINYYYGNLVEYGDRKYLRADKVLEGTLAPNENLKIVTYVQATTQALSEVKWFDTIGTGYTASNPLSVRISKVNAPTTVNNNWTINSSQDVTYTINPTQLANGLVIPWTMNAGDVFRIEYAVTTSSTYNPATNPLPQGSFGLFVTNATGEREYHGVGTQTQITDVATRVNSTNFLSFPAQILFPFATETASQMNVSTFAGTPQSYPGDGTWGSTSAKRYVYNFRSLLPPSSSSGDPFSVLSQGTVSYKSDAISDNIGFTFKLPQSCTTCNLKTWYAQSSNFGNWQASLDGTNIGSVQDGYHTSLRTVDAVGLGTSTVASGAHQIKFTVTGKNASSFGYQIGPGSITVERP